MIILFRFASKQQIIFVCKLIPKEARKQFNIENANYRLMDMAMDIYHQSQVDFNNNFNGQWSGRLFCSYICSRVLWPPDAVTILPMTLFITMTTLGQRLYNKDYNMVPVNSNIGSSSTSWIKIAKELLFSKY